MRGKRGEALVNEDGGSQRGYMKWEDGHVRMKAVISTKTSCSAFIGLILTRKNSQHVTDIMLTDFHQCPISGIKEAHSTSSVISRASQPFWFKTNHLNLYPPKSDLFSPFSIYLFFLKKGNT